MPINFQNLPSSVKETETFPALKKYVQEFFYVTPDVNVNIGVNRVTLERHGVMVHLPFGIGELTNKDELVMGAVRDRVASIFSAKTYLDPMTMKTVHGTTAEGALDVQPPKAFSDMTDEEWIESVSEKLFPEAIELSEATTLHQTVHGTSGGSIYKTCFIGPELKVACRLKTQQVSFRFTTDKNLCPTGEVNAVIKALGVTNEYSTRMTVHAPMPGPYNETHAASYRALFGAYYAALRPYITTDFPSIQKLGEGVA